MRGWRWIPIHLPFSPSTVVSHNPTNCTSITYITISFLVDYHPLLTVSQLLGNVLATGLNAQGGNDKNTLKQMYADITGADCVDDINLQGM